MDGAFLVDKPAGISSFGVIARIESAWARHTGLKRKAAPKFGHGGTLDPFATGLLVVFAGRGTKCAEIFLGSDKTYSGTISFGRSTASGDPTTEVTATTEKLPESLDAVRGQAASFESTPYLQTPPMHSALKIDGTRLYELARKGVSVPRQPRTCRVSDFEILEDLSASDLHSTKGISAVRFRVKVSSGTYIRVLAQDLAERLGSLGTLASLRRERSGDLDLSGSRGIPLGSFDTTPVEDWPTLPGFIPLDHLLSGFPSVQLNDAEARRLFVGDQSVLFDLLRRVPETAPADRLAAYHEGRLRAVIRRRPTAVWPEPFWAFERVFLPDSTPTGS